MPAATAEHMLEEGISLLRVDEIRLAHEQFKKCYASKPHETILPAVESYYGYTLALIENRTAEGFRLMHKALKGGFFRADFFLNLGKAYLKKKNDRKQALSAFYNGLKYSPHHAEILSILQEIGTRRPPVVKFLRRAHPINVLLGKKRHQREEKKFRLQLLSQNRKPQGYAGMFR